MKRKYSYKSVLLFFLFSSVIGFGQNRKERKADREYENYAYVDAIKVYKNMAEKGFINTSILSKLGDSYYFNGKFSEAYKWYDELFQGSYLDKDLASLDAEYYYRYAQTLKSMNQPGRADAILQEFVTLKSSDSRAQLFITNDELVTNTLAASRFSKINLSINSEYSDYGATLANNRLIFTSARLSEEMKNKIHNWTNQNYTKLYASTIGDDGSFSEPVLYAKEIASGELNMGTAVFTKDGQTMYFTSNHGSTRGNKRAQYNEEETSLLKIYRARKQQDDSWGAVEELPFNLDQYNTAHPALTPDEQWLYFVSDRQGTIGQSDLFRVSIYESGRFGVVENLGNQINTAGRETFPFISSDYTLYFSSDGYPGFGGLDLFKAKINRDGKIGVPINLGPDINTGFDDFGIYIDAATKKGFFSSNTEGGQGGDDIYLFVETPCYQIVDGVILDEETQSGLGGVEIVYYDATQKPIGQVLTDEQGYYKIDQLDCGNQYRIRVVHEGYFTREFTVDTTRELHQRHNLALEPDGTKIKKGDDLFKKLKLNPIYFDFDKSNIRPDAQIELMKIVEVLLQYPDIKLNVHTHTDSRGNDAYNLRLSERRAQSTIQWMINRGIDAHRLEGKGFGETQLINNCSNGVRCSEAEHQANRRSEFIISNN